MRSPMRPVRVLLSTLALTLLAAGLCACGTLSAAPQPASGCSALVPSSWKAGVPSADLPAGQTVGDWVAFGDEQTGQLDKANDRTKASIEITEKCEARDAAAHSKPFWKFW